MPPPDFIIIIATCRRSPLLHRSLESIADCVLPPRLRRIVVVENGPKLEAEAIVARFTDRLPLVYQHVRDASKSAALNRALAGCRDEFVIFLDDDIRLHPQTLTAYADAVAAHRRGWFIGGRCLVDYEEAPPEWLLPYLPLSAKGWSLGPQTRRLTAPHALGFNWGAFAEDLRLAGGFDPAHGPGCAVSIGEETRVQEQLLAIGVKGLYLPEALVWHYVPRERCSHEWALKRSELMGYCAGERLVELHGGRRVAQRVSCRLRIAAYSTLLGLIGHRVGPAMRFHFQQRRAWRTGYARGVRDAARHAVQLLPRPDPGAELAAPVAVVREAHPRALSQP